MPVIHIPDPFPGSQTNPIGSGNPGFYEWDELTTQVIDHLRAGASVSLVGEHRAGKTSLLSYLSSFLPVGEFLPVFVDAQKTMPKTDKIFLGRLVREAVSAICKNTGLEAIPTTTSQATPEQEVYLAFEHDLEILREHLPLNAIGQTLRLVWLIDEIEMLRGFQDTHLFSFLRPLAQSDVDFCMVVTSRDVLYHLEKENNSYLFSAFRDVRIRGLNLGIARQLIDDAVLAMDVSIAEHVYDASCKWTGRKPFFLKWLMSSIAVSLNEQQSRAITSEIFTQAQNIFLNKLTDHFFCLWQELSKSQQLILSLIASQPEPYDHPTIFTWLQEHKLVQQGGQQARQHLIENLMRLEQLGFLYEQAGSYTFTSGCLRTWIEQKKPL
jgi:hypothetical protein